MKKSVTLAAEVEKLIRREMRRSGKSFNDTLNAAIRRGLARRAIRGKPFVVRPKAMGLNPGIDLLRLNQLADHLETDEFLAKQKRNV